MIKKNYLFHQPFIISSPSVVKLIAKAKRLSSFAFNYIFDFLIILFSPPKRCPLSFKITIYFNSNKFLYAEKYEKYSKLKLSNNLQRKYYDKLIWISPHSITKVLKGTNQAFIDSSSWNKSAKDFDIDQSILDISNGVNYKSTEQYSLMLSQLYQTGKSRWCTSLDDLDCYFQIWYDMMDDFKKGIYKTQCEINDAHIPNSYLNEIQVSIDENNAFYLERGGTHRLSAAKIFNLDIIPVVCIRFHPIVFLEHYSSLYNL